ncbi:MAG: LAGLIDADG family homing endonuclease, partial [Eubacteriales bacterium]|nr:LAGLIDADG family homing endonuclease [Eubacteriales bacterium]
MAAYKLKDYKPTRFMAPDSHYDKAAADYAVAFIESLCHTKGKWAGKPFKLIDWQERIVRDIFGVLKPNGYRQFNTAYVEIPKKMGKQVALDTPIPTPDGFSTMGAIAVGDVVFDERGKPCRVVAKSAVDYAERAYRITFKDGEVIEAGENHQWFGEYTHGKNKPCILTTGELVRLPRDRSCFRFRIPLAGALEMPDADLPVEPYLYGYWLGNGNAVKPEITVKTGDVAAVLRHILPFYTVCSVRKNTGDSLVFRIPLLRCALLDSFRDKIIPVSYLRASKEQRLRLLQGLMDSDGAISNRKGQATYTSTECGLAGCVSELLWCLGIKNSIETAVSTQRVDWSLPSAECGRIETGETLYYVKFTA